MKLPEIGRGLLYALFHIIAALAIFIIAGAEPVGASYLGFEAADIVTQQDEDGC